MKESTTFNSQEQVKRFLALTVDVEQSYAPSLKLFEKSVQDMLAVFSANGWKTTCFVEGAVVDRCPGLLRLLSNAGHEVGSHGYRHQDQRTLSREELERDLDRALHQFAAEGVPCVGYRAPFFLRHPHLEQVLLERNIPYDSSCPRIWFPGRYDNRHIPSAPHETSSGLLQVPVGAVRPWLPLSIEHHKALKWLFPTQMDVNDQVLYVHSYSFGSGYKRPFFNRVNNLQTTVDSILTVSGDATLGSIGELLARTGARGENEPRKRQTA